MQTHRPILMNDSGIVVAGHHRAAEAGAEVLRRGGNAFDAAVAASATLCVAVPNMNGIGGDAFALLYQASTSKVTTVNGSGAAPLAASVATYRARGLDAIPPRGPLSLSTPGLVHAWQTVLDQFGTLPLPQLLEPAVALAEAGVPIDLVLRAYFDSNDYRALGDCHELTAIYGPPGPRSLGERMRQPALAHSLRTLAANGASALYHGVIGRSLIADLRNAGALLTLEDLAAHRTLLCASLKVTYRNRAAHVAPPNSQGLALAAMLGFWDTLQPEGGRAPEPAEFLRVRQLAFTLRDRFVTDPARCNLPANSLQREALGHWLTAPPARVVTEVRGGGGDTSTLVVIDRYGNAVSWAQSLFEDFGSGVVSPQTGIVMHDRLYLEQISDDPVRGLQPGRRPFHTLCPALLIGEHGCELAIATPGDHGQPQSIFQIVTRMYDGGCNVQQAIEWPRIRSDTGTDVMIESRAPAHWSAAISDAGLAQRDVGDWSRVMGGANAIVRQRDGLLLAGGDPRRASYAVCA